MEFGSPFLSPSYPSTVFHSGGKRGVPYPLPWLLGSSNKGSGGSGGEDGGGNEDGVRRKGMVWRMVGVCRPEPVVVWGAVEVVRTVVV